LSLCATTQGEAGGIEVDRCTFCEGIFFDAGELEDLFSKRQDERRAIWRRVLGL
jgi:Zn-finger nucleic acid-binding protein